LRKRERQNERDVRDVVKLGDDVVQELGPDVSVLGLDLRREVTKSDDGGLIRSNEERSDEELIVSHPFGVTNQPEPVIVSTSSGLG
jgi:hypothetical protein